MADDLQVIHVTIFDAYEVCGCQALTWTRSTLTRSISTVCQTNTCLFDVSQQIGRREWRQRVSQMIGPANAE